ncbi:MAG: hypothetical protein FWH11_09535 [Micrococcales bacterium]|nr:hypothetical protein [Micrococcales bacterium]
MSNYRLSRVPAPEFRRAFDTTGLRFFPDEAEAKIEVDSFQFAISFSLDDNGHVAPEHMAAAREILDQIGDLDAIATRDIDGKEEDGELAVVIILSEDEVDFRYYAVAWNSDWSEVFARCDDGTWVHRGIRKHQFP